jgi:hypothetical protein
MSNLPGHVRPAPGNRTATPAHGITCTQLTHAELAVVTERLRELAQRLTAFHDRLGVVQTAVQSLPGVTSRSIRVSRSSNRSRSS